MQVNNNISIQDLENQVEEAKEEFEVCKQTLHLITGKAEEMISKITQLNEELAHLENIKSKIITILINRFLSIIFIKVKMRVLKAKSQCSRNNTICNYTLNPSKSNSINSP